MDISIDQSTLTKASTLYAIIKPVKNVTIKTIVPHLEGRKDAAILKWRGAKETDILSLPLFKAYKRLHDSFGIYAKDVPPAVENIYIRGILKERFPTINSAVDASNVVSVENMIPVGNFDADRIEGGITLRLAESGDEMTPIGKDKPQKIPAGTPVLADLSRVFSMVGVRDSRDTMIRPETRNILLFSWGTDEVDRRLVEGVLDEAARLIMACC
jgi:DNA/RNA-binding domain of Phe-tRNA-synthetase-like protein